MSALILIRGLPGSGKTTLAKKLLQQDNTVHFEADMFFTSKKGQYLFQANRLPQAHQWCIRKTRQALKQKQRVIVSNTFTRQSEMQPYLDMVHDTGCELTVYVTTGTWPSVHQVPAEVIKKMRARWESYPTETVLNDIDIGQ